MHLPHCSWLSAFVIRVHVPWTTELDFRSPPIVPARLHNEIGPHETYEYTHQDQLALHGLDLAYQHKYLPPGFKYGQKSKSLYYESGSFARALVKHVEGIARASPSPRGASESFKLEVEFVVKGAKKDLKVVLTLAGPDKAEIPATVRPFPLTFY
jgi:hypothetical protein